MLQLTGNRNKRSLALNLKSPEGVAIARKLVARADIVAENYRPGVMAKLGLGYDDIRAMKPDIIYAAASGFGPDGPYVDRPGQDSSSRPCQGWRRLPARRRADREPLAYRWSTIMARLCSPPASLPPSSERGRTGQGGRVDVNLLTAALDLQMESLVCFLNGDRRDDVRQTGPLSGWYFGAPYGIYSTRDSFIAISLGSLDALSEALGIPAHERVPDAQAYERRKEAAAGVARALKARTTAEWREIFTTRGIWHSAVDDYSRLADDPQVVHNKSFITVTGATGAPVTLVAHPVRYDGATPPVRPAPQKLGAQTADILSELGYDDRAVRALFESGVAAGERRDEVAPEPTLV